jgi:hypothetical protein
MVWPAQNPPATDVILHVNVPCAGGMPAYLEIDKLSDGRYRATVGTLFEHQEICRTGDLEALVRQGAVSSPHPGNGAQHGADFFAATD